jgi:hypothetical protein
MFKKIMSFLVSFYLNNILSYFILWRTIVLNSYDKVNNSPNILKEFEKNGLTIEKMKTSFLKNDLEIFNPFFQIGFYFSTWMFIPSLILSSIIIYLIFYRKKIRKPDITV